MQVAAADPKWVSRDQVPPAEIEKEKDIFRAQMANAGKPAAVIEKIVDGKIEKFYRDICLLEQEYVRDPQLTIAKLLAQSGRKLTVKRFVRYQLGEGIEKRSENLAEAVAAQIAQGS